MLPEILLVAAFSGLVQGLSGFAFGLMATSLWAWMMEPQLVVPMVVLGSLVGQVTSIQSVKRHVQRERIVPFLIGGAIGVPLGIHLLHLLNVPVFRASVGLGLVIYCSIMLRFQVLPRISSGGRSADGCVGFAAGLMGGVSGIAGPPITLWCSLRGWSKNVQRATYQPFFIAVQTMSLALLTWHGLINLNLLRLFMWVAPVIVLSSWFGSRVARRFSDLRFQRIVFVLLLVSGVMLVLPLMRVAIQRCIAQMA